MERPLITVGVFTSWAMKFSILGVVFYALFYKGDIPLAILALAAFGITLTPTILSRNYRITLPPYLDFLIALALMLDIVFGEGARFYDWVTGWDWMTHFIGTFVIAMFAFSMVYTFHYTGKLRLSLPFIAFFTMMASLAVGALWEIAEFIVDHFGYNSQKGLNNTMWDLIFDAVGGVAVAVLGVLYMRYLVHRERRQLVSPFKRFFKTFFSIEMPKFKRLRKKRWRGKDERVH
ncbi:MAG: hypothetical protein AAB275_09615 [Deltaproteobacteria bacterium]